MCDNLIAEGYKVTMKSRTLFNVNMVGLFEMDMIFDG